MLEYIGMPRKSEVPSIRHRNEQKHLHRVTCDMHCTCAWGSHSTQPCAPAPAPRSAYPMQTFGNVAQHVCVSCLNKTWKLEVFERYKYYVRPLLTFSCM